MIVNGLVNGLQSQMPGTRDRVFALGKGYHAFPFPDSDSTPPEANLPLCLNPSYPLIQCKRGKKGTSKQDSPPPVTPPPARLAAPD